MLDNCRLIFKYPFLLVADIASIAESCCSTIKYTFTPLVFFNLEVKKYRKSINGAVHKNHTYMLTVTIIAFDLVDTSMYVDKYMFNL